MMRYCLTAIVFIGIADSVLGHGLLVEARHRAGKLVVTVQFDDGIPVKNAVITLPINQRGQTDDQGMATLEIPGLGNHLMTIDAGDGHVANINITVRPMPWTEGELFSPTSRRSVFSARLLPIFVGVVFIFFLMFIAMWSLRRRQPL